MSSTSRLLALAVLVSTAAVGCGAASSGGGSTPSAACAPAPGPTIPAGTTAEEKRALGRVQAQLDRLGQEQSALCEAHASHGGDDAGYAAKKGAIDDKRTELATLAKELDGASTAGKRKRALDKLYRTAVPVDQRTEEITFRFGVRAELPGGGGEIDVLPGAALPTGARVRFRVEVTKQAHVYIFQKTPNDEITVLFPEPRIGTKNPLDPGVAQDLPAGGQRFKLNDKDVGTENVYLVVSRTPLPTLDAALARVKDGSVTKVGQNDLLKALSMVTPGTPPEGCKTRALELEGPTPAASGGTCHRSRGLVLEEPGAGSGPRSRDMEVRTDAGDGLIVKVFPFQHVRGASVEEMADDDAGAAAGEGFGAIGGAGGQGAPSGGPPRGVGSKGGQQGGMPSGPPVSRGIVMED